MNRGRPLHHGVASSAALLAGFLAGPARAEAGKPTVIEIDITETYSQGGAREHGFIVTLSNRNQVEETENISKTGRRRRAGVLSTQDTNETMGANNGHVEWHVLGPHKLQRVQLRGVFIEIWNVEIGENNACHIDAKYLMQSGFENETKPHVASATCFIQ